MDGGVETRPSAGPSRVASEPSVSPTHECLGNGGRLVRRRASSNVGVPAVETPTACGVSVSPSAGIYLLVLTAERERLISGLETVLEVAGRLGELRHLLPLDDRRRPKGCRLAGRSRSTALGYLEIAKSIIGGACGHVTGLCTVKTYFRAGVS